MVLEDRFYCLDGDLSSFIKSSSVHPNANEPFWSTTALCEDREKVVEAHAEFIRSGANVIRTNTFEASAKLFLDRINSFRDPVHGPYLVMEDAVKVTEEAILRETLCPRKVLIAGSLGPYDLSYDSSKMQGTQLEREELKEWHLVRMKRLAIGGVDVFAAEGIPSVEEALAIIEAVDTLSGATCWINFRCPDKTHIASGERLDDAFKKLSKHPAFRFKVKAVGVDRCSPEDITHLLKLLNSVNHWSACPDVLGYRKVPYIVCPTIGLNSRARENDMNYIVNQVEEWTILGANVIGGCTGASPDDIKRISDALLAAVLKARESRDVDARKTRSTEDDWTSVLNRLKKPSFADQKKSEEAAQQAFRDIGDGGGLFSRIHSQMEQIIRENEEKITNS